MQEDRFMLPAPTWYYTSESVHDIMMIVSFVRTQVQYVTEDDKHKLEQFLAYLHTTQEDKLVSHLCKPFDTGAYIDAAFTLSKSHNGVLIIPVVGGVIIFAASRNQRCVTKIPVESNKSY